MGSNLLPGPSWSLVIRRRGHWGWYNREHQQVLPGDALILIGSNYWLRAWFVLARPNRSSTGDATSIVQLAGCLALHRSNSGVAVRRLLRDYTAEPRLVRYPVNGLLSGLKQCFAGLLSKVSFRQDADHAVKSSGGRLSSDPARLNSHPDTPRHAISQEKSVPGSVSLWHQSSSEPMVSISSWHRVNGDPCRLCRILNLSRRLSTD